MTWLTRWWHEGNGDKERLREEEEKLRKAVSVHTEESLNAKVRAEVATDRASRLIMQAERTIDIIQDDGTS